MVASTDGSKTVNSVPEAPILNTFTGAEAEERKAPQRTTPGSVTFTLIATEFFVMELACNGTMNWGYFTDFDTSKRKIANEDDRLAGYLFGQSLHGVIIGPLPAQFDDQQLIKQFRHTIVP